MIVPEGPMERQEDSLDDLLARLDGALEGLDPLLDEEEERQTRRRARRNEELQGEIDRVERALARALPRLERARVLDLDAAVDRIGPLVADLEQRREAAVGELGYDPAEKRKEEAARRSREESEGLVRRAAAAAARAAVADLALALRNAIPRLLRADAGKACDAITGAAQRTGWTPDSSFEDLIQALTGDENAEDAEKRYEELGRRIGRETAALAELDQGLEDLEQETLSIETAARKLPQEAIRARVHALACRAKLLQQKHAGDLDFDRSERLRRHVFGRLHTVVKQSGCGFVPSLRQSWFPASLEDEIGKAEARFRELASVPPAGPGSEDPPASGVAATEELLRRAEERLDQAERWVLAEVYRWSNACYLDPEDVAAQDRLRAAARHGLDYLETRREELPAVLRHDAPLFAEGSEFRWLRRRFAKLESAADKEIESAPEEQEDAGGSGSLETLTGEAVLHPSVLRAQEITRGRSLAMVGGAVREKRRERLAELFETKNLEWIASERSDGLRGIQQLTARIRSGSPDLVICLFGFMRHAASEAVVKAVREADTPCAIVPRGYGEVAIAQAVIETRRNR